MKNGECVKWGGGGGARGTLKNAATCGKNENATFVMKRGDNLYFLSFYYIQ